MTTLIGIKQLHQELFRVAEAVENGTTFIVVKHSKPIFKIEPVHDEVNRKPDLSAFKKIQFHRSKITNPSEHIDEIIYGNY